MQQSRGASDDGGAGFDVVQYNASHADQSLLADSHALSQGGTGTDVGSRSDVAETADDGAGGQERELSDGGVVADDHAGGNGRPVPDFHAPADRCSAGDIDAATDRGVGRNGGKRVDQRGKAVRIEACLRNDLRPVPEADIASNDVDEAMAGRERAGI